MTFPAKVQNAVHLPNRPPMYEPYPAGSRVAFFGDSLTRLGGCMLRVAAQYRALFPKRDVRFFNVGISGGGLAAANLYLDAWLAPIRPTHVVLATGAWRRRSSKRRDFPSPNSSRRTRSPPNRDLATGSIARNRLRTSFRRNGTSFATKRSTSPPDSQRCAPGSMQTAEKPMQPRHFPFSSVWPKTICATNRRRRRSVPPSTQTAP